MSDRKEKLIGHPSDYGSRTLESEEEDLRTADGEPRVDRGSADSAISHDQVVDEREKKRSHK